MLAQSLISKKHDIDACQGLEASSPVGLPESLNISSDLEIVPSIQDSDDSQLGGEPSSTEEAQPVKDLLRFEKPTDSWGNWLSGYNDTASTTSPPAPLTFKGEALVPTSTPKKSKKSTKKRAKTSSLRFTRCLLQISPDLP